MNVALMSGRVALLRCSVLLTALGVGVAQTNLTSLGTGSQTSKEVAKKRALELNRQGSDSVTAKQFEQAKALFKQAIDLNPRLSDAYENLALILLLDGDDVAAEHTAVELLARAPGNYNARLVAGIAALNRNKFSRGKYYLFPLIKNGVDDPLVITAYAIGLEASGDKSAAASFNARSAKLRVEASDALLAGQIFRQRKLKAVAQKWIEASVADARAAVNPDLLYILATMYSEQGRITDACALYSRVLEVSPGNVDALIELSELERALGEQEKALSHLYTAKTLAATDPATLIHFSQVCLRRRMYVDARDALKKVVAQDPVNRHAWYQLGLAQFRIGETEAAETDFKAALALDQSDQWSRIGLGAVLTSTGRDREAAVEFHRVLQSNSRSAAAHYYLGLIHRANGDTPLALHELEQAVNDANRDARPLAALGQLQLSVHDLRSARRSLRKAIDLDPTYSTAHYYMAMLLRTVGQTDEAKNEIERYKKYHDEENKEGIVGLVSEGKWDYAGFLPPN